LGGRRRGGAAVEDKKLKPRNPPNKKEKRIKVGN